MDKLGIVEMLMLNLHDQIFLTIFGKQKRGENTKLATYHHILS